MLSGRGLCDGPSTCPEESECDPEISATRKSKHTVAVEPQKNRALFCQ